MVTCTAITPAILQPPRQGSASQNGGEAERVAGHNVDAGQEPLSLLHQRETFEGVAGERGVRAAEADGDQQTPARVKQRAFGREDKKESEDKAAGNVDQQRAVGEGGYEIAGDECAEEVARAGSDNSAKRDPYVVGKIVGDEVHNRVLLQKFCRSHQPNGRLTANSIAKHQYNATGSANYPARTVPELLFPALKRHRFSRAAGSSQESGL